MRLGNGSCTEANTSKHCACRELKPTACHSAMFIHQQHLSINSHTSHTSFPKENLEIDSPPFGGNFLTIFPSKFGLFQMPHPPRAHCTCPRHGCAASPPPHPSSRATAPGSPGGRRSPDEICSIFREVDGLISQVPWCPTFFPGKMKIQQG